MTHSCFSSRSIAPIFLMVAGSIASAQVAFSNSGSPSDPGVATGNQTRSGVFAPNGSQWSETASDLSAANSFAGLACESLGASRAYRLADDFTLASPTELQSLVIYGYSATATPMPIIDASLNLWSGLPNAVGSTIVFSSGGPGTVLSQWPISVFRIFSSSTTPLPPVPDFSRPIWAIEINSATTLAAGTYWLDVSFTCADASAPFFAIPLRPASGRTSAGWNALQRSPDGVWAAVADSGKPRGAADVPLDLAFQLLSGFSCPGDWDNSGSADSDDIIAFFSDWDRGEGDADGSGGTDSDDIIVFFASWETGC